MKLWDLSTQHCVQTVVAHRSEIWSLAVDAEQKLVFTGSGEGEMKAWGVDHQAMIAGLHENESGEVCYLDEQRDLIAEHILPGHKNDLPNNNPSVIL
jgi:WD40 repeat protein